MERNNLKKMTDKQLKEARLIDGEIYVCKSDIEDIDAMGDTVLRRQVGLRRGGISAVVDDLLAHDA